MGFTEAVRSGFENYFNFADRSSRSEYRYWILFGVPLGIVTSILDNMFGGIVIGSLVSLALFFPGLAVAIRRRHDIGKSGWNLLWGLIPVLGWIYVIYLMVQPTQPGANRYGPAPLAQLGPSAAT